MSKIQYLSQEGYDKLDRELRDLKTRGVAKLQKI